MANSPGKVLFFGGYSVLEFGNISLVFAVVDDEGKGVYSKVGVGEKRIISRQFGIDEVPNLESKNLVSKAYAVGETYLKSKGKWRNDLTIELFNSPIFGDKEEKSGLGSSAASTTTVIKSLFEGNGLSVEFHKESIFKLSQIAYALYSNKIGSGFDIAVSSFGKTIKYFRYDPNEIDFERIIESVDKPWEKVDIEEVKIPKKYDLLFFNIKTKKTETIKAVKGFKRLKQEKPEVLKALLKEQDRWERKAIEALVKGDDKEVRFYTHKAREVHKKLSEEIMKVEKIDPIEPEELTHVIEEGERLDGIVAGRAPGSGGYDGLAFIINKNEFDKSNVETLLELGKEVGLELHKLDLNII